MKIIALAVAFMAALQSGGSAIRSIEKGTASSASELRQVVVRDGAAWEKFWSEHAPERPRPAVDFAREMVVGVFVGDRPTAGYTVEIFGYRESGDDVTVQYRETTPARGTVAAQVIVSPYHLAAIPKKTGKVSFEQVTTSLR